MFDGLVRLDFERSIRFGLRSARYPIASVAVHRGTAHSTFVVRTEHVVHVVTNRNARFSNEPVQTWTPR